MVEMAAQILSKEALRVVVSTAILKEGNTVLADD